MSALNDTRIDRTSAVPYYLQLAQMMEAEMDRGAFGPGDRLPTESDLCRDYDLARSTVRETLRHLQDQGRIKVVPRRGAFVAEPAQSGWLLQSARGFLEAELDHKRDGVETRVLTAKRCKLPPAASEALGLPVNAPGFMLARVRRLDGKLALYSVNYLLPELEDTLRESDVLSGKGSLTRALRLGGFETARARRSVAAVAAEGDAARVLKTPDREPLLLVTSVSWDKRGKPFDFYTSWIKSDVVQIAVEAMSNGND